MYKSLLQPLIFYGLSIWGQGSKTSLNKVLVLQKRALRLIFFKKQSESAIPLFIDCKILPVTLQYYQSLAELMFDVSSNRAPSNILNMFDKLNTIHRYNTRGHAAGNLYLKFSRLEIQKRSFSRTGVTLWNKIPNHLKDLPKTCFKKSIKEMLFHNLTDRGYHVEVSNLTFIS
jgi:hypothetical protein